MDTAAIGALVMAGAGLVTSITALVGMSGKAKDSTVLGFKSLVEALQREVTELRLEHGKCQQELAVLTRLVNSR